MGENGSSRSPSNTMDDSFGGEFEFSSSINWTVQLSSMEFDANSELYPSYITQFKLAELNSYSYEHTFELSSGLVTEISCL